MIKERSICRRCHRLRVVDRTRCCADCNEILRALEQPKKHAPVPADLLPSPEDLKHAQQSLLELSPEERFVEKLYESAVKRSEQKAFLRKP